MKADPLNILCSQLVGVGPKTSELLYRLDLITVQDLLFHLPIRYENRTKISLIRQLRIGEYAVVVVTVVEKKLEYHKRPVLYCTVQDGTGRLKICFYNFTRAKLQYKLGLGIRLYCYGKLCYVGGYLGMIHPEYRILLPDAKPYVAKKLSPVYHTTKGLSQIILRKLILQALAIASDNRMHFECFPNSLLKKYDLPNIVDALLFIHEPESQLEPTLLLNRKHFMRRRLIFEELLSFQLMLMKLRLKAKSLQAIALSWNDKLMHNFINLLPFDLTRSQLKVLKEIATDLCQSKPMLRLLQGDVGCGKTVVAVLSILQVANCSYQSAFMSPTDILSEQHFRTISKLLEPFNVKVVLLNGKIKGSKKKIVYKDIESGEVQVVVGTHSLIQDSIKFNNLGLIVIDEQQRFGVHQRFQLSEKGFKNEKTPHQLVMTATPIPRTLGMAMYADLDCSIIDEFPDHKASVSTILVSNNRREELISRIRDNCLEGKQVYWVCPTIEASENMDVQAAESLVEKLANRLPEVRIGLIHGRKSGELKEQVMKKFFTHEIDLLVATTVIEVGVDVPNASLIIIENAERLGLVQLHQLRGRVGRGDVNGFCVLMYNAPLSRNAKKRLLLLRKTSDGFKLASEDLKMRGLGELFGTKQAGIPQMRLADLNLDCDLIPKVRQVANFLLHNYGCVASIIIARWIGIREKYCNIF